MEATDFYNIFHNNSSMHTNIISESNFTYINVIPLLKKLIKYKSLKILDYGCGTGTIALYLASKGHEVIGVDISNKALKVASESSTYLHLDSHCKFIGIKRFTKIKNTKYDLIICSEVIEHTPDDMGLLKLLYKKLNSKGLLLITTPSINAPLYKLGFLKNFDIQVGHLRRYNVNDLSLSLIRIGFNIIYVQKIEGVLRNSLFTLKYLGWIIKFLKGPFSYFAHFLDKTTIYLFGESNILILAQKK